MADGSSEPISKLRAGDLVEAYDPATGKTGPHTVTAVMVNRDPATELLVLDTGAIETTPNHPFYTADRGWVEAGVLKLGERIRTATGTDATVVSFTIDPHPASMWDITVAGAHSFFVGSGAVLVHNCDLHPNWTQSSFGSDHQSFWWHYEEHGLGEGVTPGQYAANAATFRSTVISQGVKGADTQIAGGSGKTFQLGSKWGGILDDNWNIVTFWYGHGR